MKRLTIQNFPSLEYECEEAINSLCTLLTVSGENMKKIAITSCHESEGKTWIAMNVVRKLAQLGLKVALVEADLRRGTIISKYGLEFENSYRNLGLTEYLAGKGDIESILYETDIPGLSIVPCNMSVPNSLALLSSPRLELLLRVLSQRMDYVIVDTPPAGLISDAAQIAKSCDGALITVQYNAVRRKELAEVLDQLEQVGCPVLGTVLNQVEYDSYINKKYYYKSYYSQNDNRKDTTRKERRRRSHK